MQKVTLLKQEPHPKRRSESRDSAGLPPQKSDT